MSQLAILLKKPAQIFCAGVDSIACDFLKTDAGSHLIDEYLLKWLFRKRRKKGNR